MRCGNGERIKTNGRGFCVLNTEQLLSEFNLTTTKNDVKFLFNNLFIKKLITVI